MSSPLQFGDPLTMLLFLVPAILCCTIGQMKQRSPQQKGFDPSLVDVEVWYTPVAIGDIYDAIEKGTEEWTRLGEEEEVPPQPSEGEKKQEGLAIFQTRKKKAVVPRGFRIVQENPPRLLRLASSVEGEVIFDLTESDVGGTTLKVTYSYVARERVLDLKSKLPLKARVLRTCPGCGKSLSEDYPHCPYCGKEL